MPKYDVEIALMVKTEVMGEDLWIAQMSHQGIVAIKRMAISFFYTFVGQK